jgi:hypothetical protein
MTVLCVYCGTEPGGTSDHVPPKLLLRKPYPPNLRTVPSCGACNNGFSADEEYFRLAIIGLYCHTPEAEQLFDGPMSRSMDRRAALEELMFGSLVPAAGGAIADLDAARIGRIVGKITRGLAFALAGTAFPPAQVFDWDFCEVDGPSAVGTFGPDFTFTPPDPLEPWEFTLFDSVRFTARAT